ncbi:Panacea domain-containing protein [Acinetobacter pollinis]|uniref:Panacea domain-containing protein n=1 Tax=Acinetobacter pollinis TaxID=2605270 RepID=UPI0018C1FBF1|nr:type II toxin-antitoxin system antitoxin SocA domain-containing protein [Acinetobacter pollinis]MBF7693293.1 DUF4065 domain-containing protein [Acinetobacter pollinis]MBF7699452.1 DUF4065 domain-containing protein [Acinetobacter pollinis]
MTHTALQVADKILELGREKGLEFTQMQLLKLVYIAHGWMLGAYNKPLICNQIQAWKYGPVIPDLYSSIKVFGASKINTDSLVGTQKDIFTEDELDVMEFTLKAYGDNSAAKLSNITHMPDTPWSSVYNNDGWAEEIPDALIKQHYKKLYQKYFDE